MFAWLRDWTPLLPLLEILFALPSILIFVDFWRSVTCIVLDFEPADRNAFKKMWVFLDGNVLGYSFCLPKNEKPTKQVFWCTENLHRSVWNSACLDHSELANNLLKDLKVKNFAKRTEKCEINGNLLHKKMGNIDDHGCPKLSDLVVPKADGDM